MDIKPVGPVSISPLQPSNLKPTPQAWHSTFGGVLKRAVGDVNSLQEKADTSVQGFLLGKADNINDVMLKVTKAELGFNFLLEVRNKAVEAYREIQRMQV